MTDARPFGKRWGLSYGPDEAAAVCGYFMNPDASAIHLLRWCGEPAVYGFRPHCNPGDLGDQIFVAMDGWDGACEEHAAVVRQHDEVCEMWSLPRRSAERTES